MRKSSAAIAVLLLAACGGQSGNEQGAEGEAGGAAGASVSLQPGQWEMTTEVVSMNIPNMPAGMTPPMPPPTTVRTCLTPEQAAAPGGDFITGSGEGGGCRSENMSMENGRIQGTVQCQAEGGSMTAAVSGQFTPTSYEINQQVETSAEGMTMEMESRTTGRRVGDCPA